MVVGGILFATMIYVTFRLVWYGRLIQSAIGTPSNENLQDYFWLVRDYAVGNLSLPLLFIKHYTSATSEIFIDPFNGLLTSVLLGTGFFAFVMKTFFEIKDKPVDFLRRS